MCVQCLLIPWQCKHCLSCQKKTKKNTFCIQNHKQQQDRENKRKDGLRTSVREKPPWKDKRTGWEKWGHWSAKERGIEKKEKKRERYMTQRSTHTVRNKGVFCRRVMGTCKWLLPHRTILDSGKPICYVAPTPENNTRKTALEEGGRGRGRGGRADDR